MKQLFSSRTLQVAVSFVLIANCNVGLSQQHWQRHTVDDSSQGADGVRIGDFNGDSLPDIVTGWEEGGIVRVYKNPGPKNTKLPWPSVTIGSSKDVEDAVFVDLDGDGNLDVVSSCEGKNKQVNVHWAPKKSELMNSTKWSTDSFPATAKLTRWMFCLPLDVDGTHGIDLVVGSKDPEGQIGWLESPATDDWNVRRDLSKWKYHKWQDCGWTMSLKAIDFDEDNDLDVLVSDRKGKNKGVYWLENINDKSAAQDWPRHNLMGENLEVMFRDAFMTKHLGPLTVVATRNGSIEIRLKSNLLENTAVGNPFNVMHGKAVAIGDIDLDGEFDVVHTANTQDEENRVAGVAWFTAGSARKVPKHKHAQPLAGFHPISNFEGKKFDRIELLDLDADGDLDVLTCEERDNLGVIWYENPTR